MEPLIEDAACSPKSEKSDANNSMKARNPVGERMKHTKMPRLKCEVCCRGFQKEKALLRHKQSHCSGAFSERYSEKSATCSSPGSVACAQRYLTLNIAMAMKLRESRFYDNPAGGISKHMKKKKGLNQMKGTKKLDQIVQHQHMDSVFLPQNQSDPAPLIRSDREGMTTQSASANFSGNRDKSECMMIQNSDNTLEKSAINVSTEVESKESSKSALEMSDAWNVLVTDSADVQHPQKFSLKAIHKHNPGCKSPKAVTLRDQQALGENLHSTLKQPKQLHIGSLNQESTVTAMHDKVIKLVTSLQGEKDKHLVSLQSSQSDKTTICAEAKSSLGEESESDDSSNEDDCSPNLNDECEPFASSRNKQPPMKRKRNRAKQSTFCEICQKDFQNLKKHLITHFGEREHQCKICGKGFYEARVLERHETTHTKKFKCSVCGEMFSKVRAAKRHARIHLPDRPYSCEICKVSFRNRNHVLKHMSVHSAVKQYICDVCGQELRSITALKCHIRKHTGEKPYGCEICGKSFRYSSGLHVHSFSHTTGKPYHCPICRESFAHNYLRKRHLLTHQADQPSVMDSRGEVSRSLSSDHADHVQQKDSFHLLSSNSQTMASTSSLDHTIASSSEEALIQTEDSTSQAFSQLSSQPSSDEDHLLVANKAVKINQVLGPDSFKLLSGPGSRRKTPVDSLVVSMCDGSYKSLKALKQQERESEKNMKQE